MRGEGKAADLEMTIRKPCKLRLPPLDRNLRAGLSMDLDTITAVVIGGTSLFGGRGTMIGTLIGAILVGVVSNGLVLAGLDQAYKVLAIGILVIVAVALDQWIRKVRA